MGREAGADVLLEDVWKRFGHFDALKGVSLHVASSHVVALCGPSGSGKSTLIRTLNALERHDRGRIVVGGIELTRSAAAIRAVRRTVGMVFQHFNLFPHLTALQNVALGPREVLGLSRQEAEARAAQLLARVHLGGMSQKYPAQLSGGEQQRVAIARALAMQPRIMLFDEPTSALDAELIHEVLDVIQELAEAGMTTLIVTHELNFAARIAGRVAFMDQGQIVEQGPPEEILREPREERTRAFLSKVLPSAR
ncbi:MAG TPA: amino acid ABC transporter ATP-binding protein [Chloroflexota bacterium]|nr:amino acid ABC transporter ATP-binding protein [Chloroflexota bacterium]